MPNNYARPCVRIEALSEVPVVNGLVRQLAAIFSGQPMLSIEKAVSDGLLHALDDENIDVAEIACNRDYSKLCPEGECFDS